ncbi:MAG: hypothetical protein H3C62_05200 [Gemmatimonadaceae bacterium]|nr:hypothetical protein [Gemmatimonadaceae bacterium]
MRSEAVISDVLVPVQRGAETLVAYFHLDATTQGLAGDASPSTMDVRLALSLREKAVAELLTNALRAFRDALGAAQTLVHAPLVPLTPEEQVRYWLLEATKRPGKPVTLRFTPKREVVISRDFVDANAGLLRTLVIGLAQKYEEHRFDTLKSEGVPDDEAMELSRFAQAPSWRELCDHPELRLSDTEGLALVGIGLVLGLWTPVPALEQLDEYGPDELDLEDVPFLQPVGELTGEVLSYD